MFNASQPFTNTQAFGTSSGGIGGGDDKKKQRPEDKQVCLPVTIRAIENALSTAAGGEITFYGREQGILVLVAAVEALAKQGNAVELVLTDGTGRIKARHYVTDVSQAQVDELAVARYVSVFGSVRSSPEVHFSVTGIRLVKAADEVSFHMIEAAHAALKLQIPANKTDAKVDAATKVVPDCDGVAATAFASVPTPAKAAPLDGETLKRAILDVLKREGSGKAQGLSLASVHDFIKVAPENTIKDILVKFVDDGDLYNTIDDNHFQLLV